MGSVPTFGHVLCRSALQTVLLNSPCLNVGTDPHAALRIRKDSTLFRLRTAQDVMDRLSFFNTGPDQQAGLVVMSLNGDSPSLYAGAKYSRVVVLFNVDKAAKTIVIDQLKGRALALHPVQLASTADARAKTATVDNATGTFSIPGRTTVVFVQNAP
jgi:pullulanase